MSGKKPARPLDPRDHAVRRGSTERIRYGEIDG